MSTRRPRTRLGRIALVIGLIFVVLVTIAAVAGGGGPEPTADEAVATASGDVITTFAPAPSTTIAPARPAATPAPTTTTATIRGPPATGAPAAGTAASTEGDLVRDLLAQLRVEPERPTGYDRALFPHWITTGGCTTRAHVLIRDARGTAVVEDNCRVTAGQWHSAFDDVHLTNPRSIDIDHLVPLAEAWRSGADTWDAATRRRFANDLDDPRTLIAVTASSNRSKGDKDPANWLPTHTAYRCTYVGTWVGIKHRWNLAVDTRERSAIERVLNGCGELRTSASAPPASPSTSPAAPSTTAAPSAPASPTPTTTNPTATTTTISIPTTTIPAGACVNINTATLADLQRIVHIGSGRAEEIISMRPFSSVRDLTQVNGIGPTRLADIEAQGLACT